MICERCGEPVATVQGMYTHLRMCERVPLPVDLMAEYNTPMTIEDLAAKYQTSTSTVRQRLQAAPGYVSRGRGGGKAARSRSKCKRRNANVPHSTYRLCRRCKIRLSVPAAQPAQDGLCAMCARELMQETTP